MLFIVLSNHNYVNNIQESDLYYVITVLKRNKDIDKSEFIDFDIIYENSPFTNVNETDMILKTFIIRDLTDIIKYRDYIKYLCNTLKCRAYITTTPRRYTDFLATFVKTIGDQIINSYVSNQPLNDAIVDKVARLTSTVDISKMYLLDIDKNLSTDELDKIKSYICNKHLLTYKTFNGWHMLCTEYDAIKLNKFFETEFDNTKENKFIEQKGKGCRALLYGNIIKN